MSAVGTRRPRIDSDVKVTGSLRYAGHDHLLIDGRALIELSGRRHLWSFYNALPAEGAPDGRFWYTADSPSASISKVAPSRFSARTVTRAWRSTLS